MVVVLLILSLILVFWVTKLSASVNELRKINQYNLDVFNQKFNDIEQAFDFEKEQRELLLERIHDLERENHKILD